MVHGAVSTSGPLIAQADFPEYLEVVDNTIEITSPQCNKLVKKAMGQAARLTLHRVGWNLMGKIFKTCAPLDGSDPRNVSNIMESLIGNNLYKVVPCINKTKDWIFVQTVALVIEM